MAYPWSWRWWRDRILRIVHHCRTRGSRRTNRPRSYILERTAARHECRQLVSSHEGGTLRRSREASLARALTAPCLLRRPTNAASWRGALEIAGQRIRNDGILCSGRASASHNCAKGRAEAQVTLRCRLHRCDKGSDLAPYLPYLLDQPAPGQRQLVKAVSRRRRSGGARALTG